MALLENIGSVGTSSATTIATGTLSSAPPSGSIVLIAISQGGNGTGAATISGFATVPGLSVLSLPASAASHLTILYKVAGASEPTSYTATLNSANFAATGCWVFTGRSTGSIFTAVNSAVAGAVAATPLSIAITGVTAAAGDDVLWVSALSNSQGNGYPGPSFTPPSGLSNALTETSTTSFTVGLVGATETGVTAGSTGTLTGTMAYTGGGSNSWGGYVLSLAVAAGSSGNIVQQTQLYNPASTVTCPAFVNAVTAGHAIAMVAYAYPISLAASNTPSIGDGTSNIYNLVRVLSAPSNIFPVTFTAPPTSTSATLTAGYAGATGNSQAIYFSDGEVRKGNFTNGSTAVTWVTALTGSPGVNATTYNNIEGFLIYLCTNSVGGTVTPTFSTLTSFGISALYAAEVANVGTGNILLGVNSNVQFGPGTSTNAINSGPVSVSQTAVLFGFCCDTSAVVTPPLITGTGFSTQTAVWSNGSATIALAEDATINTSTAATFTAGHGADTFYTFAMALAGPGPFTPFTQTQFFVTDTIVQQ
jgi:hypothetical protein